jgi:hypothetical protein
MIFKALFIFEKRKASLFFAQPPLARKSVVTCGIVTVPAMIACSQNPPRLFPLQKPAHRNQDREEF